VVNVQIVLHMTTGVKQEVQPILHVGSWFQETA
jgi:hypothetical protein